ncbi:hypothetical protein M3F63_07210 [Brachybacterium muris]|uniref:hypothetical protein n=1 Tax=Brachybacterium muris TaxID=219301 RepID=UPI00223C0949|nr:hypothetical protein [Brachybacterium muris]MCT2177457.1 hypothetical protein [Brachybacterium muris]
MKRAKIRRSFPGSWAVQINTITQCPDWPLQITFWPNIPTHAEALAHALAEVGLAPKEQS